MDELGIFDRECVKVDESVAEEGVSFQKWQRRVKCTK